MSSKRILLVHGDRLLQRFFQEALEQEGYIVDVRSTLDEARLAVAERMPAVILLDLVHRQGRAANFVKLLRADPSTESIPVLLLPSALHELANAVLAVGATKEIEPGMNLITATLAAIKASFGRHILAGNGHPSFFRKDESWNESIYAEAVKILNRMRNCLPGLMSTPPETPALRELWFLVHSFAQRALFLPTRTLGLFLEEMDMLMHDLNDAPDQVNPSTLRTIAQAIDFLATVANPEALEALCDTGKARILIVDDEPGALQFISAALRLADMNADTADSAAACLEKVSEGHWDLIFLDIGLPEVDGFQLCTKIRAIDTLKDTPIVFITGMASFKNKATACLSGGDDFVGKPFNLCELGVKALTWLHRGHLVMV